MDSDRDNSKKDIDGRSSLHKSLTPAPPQSESLLNRYNKLLDRYPLRTKMCTSFVVSAFGSALGSLLSANAKETKARSRGQEVCKSQSKFAKIDWVDVFSYALHGGLINAPISHYWFDWCPHRGGTISPHFYKGRHYPAYVEVLAFIQCFQLAGNG